MVVCREAWYNKSQATLLESPEGIAGSYTIPSSVTSIGGQAFFGCANLTKITIPNSATNIGQLAFWGCTSLTGVYFQGNAPGADSSVFYSDNVTVYYLQGTEAWASNFASVPAVELTVITITANPTNGVIPFSVMFTASSLDGTGNIVSNWNWNFGDGSASTAAIPLTLTPQLALSSFLSLRPTTTVSRLPDQRPLSTRGYIRVRS